MGEALTIRVQEEDAYVIVAVGGEIDIATAGQLRDQLYALATGSRPLIADLDQATFIDAAGLGALVGASRRAAQHGARLQVVCARPQIRRLFELTGLDSHIPLTSTLTEALQDP